jgi:hypothetical protein
VARVEAEREEAGEQRMHGLGSQALGQRGRVGQVAEEHRHRLALPCQGAARGEDRLGEMFRRVGERRMVLAAGRDAVGGGTAPVAPVQTRTRSSSSTARRWP